MMRNEVVRKKRIPIVFRLRRPIVTALGIATASLGVRLADVLPYKRAGSAIGRDRGHDGMARAQGGLLRFALAARAECNR